MTDRTAARDPHHMAAYGHIVAGVLFAAVLLFGILVTLRHAYGWASVLSDGAAATIPVAADGLVAIVSALATAVGAVWFHATRLAR